MYVSFEITTMIPFSSFIMGVFKNTGDSPATGESVAPFLYMKIKAPMPNILASIMTGVNIVIMKKCCQVLTKMMPITKKPMGMHRCRLLCLRSRKCRTRLSLPLFCLEAFMNESLWSHRYHF